MYLDANNLYGWAMSQPLPMSNFKWLTDEKMKDLDVMMIPDNSSRGFILECDLSKYYFYYLYIYVYFTKYNVSFLCVSEYPHELHDLNKDYPLAPERLQIEQNILNNYQRHLLQDEGISKPPPKLVPNLCNKTNYIIHYHNLKLYLKLGLDLTNVRRVLSFDQSPWLKNYINFNTRRHSSTAAKNYFEKDFFKLMNNAFFGKSITCLFFLFCSYILIHSLQVKIFSL